MWVGKAQNQASRSLRTKSPAAKFLNKEINITIQALTHSPREAKITKAKAALIRRNLLTSRGIMLQSLTPYTSLFKAALLQAREARALTKIPTI